MSNIAKSGIDKDLLDKANFRILTNKHLHVIVAIITSFQLILASMIEPDAPFYVFWVQYAVEDLLYVLFWYYIIVRQPMYYIKITLLN